MKLYELSQAHTQVFEMVLDEDANLTTLEDTLQCIEGDIEFKVENGIRLIRSLQAFCDAVEQEKNFHEKRHKALKNRIVRIKEYYKMNMELMMKDKIKTVAGTMTLQDNAPALQIFDAAALPAEYMTIIPESYEPDKERIKADLKAGKEVSGARLAQGRHLRIR